MATTTTTAMLLLLLLLFTSYTCHCSAAAAAASAAAAAAAAAGSTTTTSSPSTSASSMSRSFSTTSYAFTLPSYYSDNDDNFDTEGVGPRVRQRPASAIGHAAYHYALTRPRKGAMVPGAVVGPHESPGGGGGGSDLRKYKVKQLKQQARSQPTAAGHDTGEAQSTTTRHTDHDHDEDNDEDDDDEERGRQQEPQYPPQQGRHRGHATTRATTKTDLRQYRYFPQTKSLPHSPPQPPGRPISHSSKAKSYSAFVIGKSSSPFHDSSRTQPREHKPNKLRRQQQSNAELASSSKSTSNLRSGKAFQTKKTKKGKKNKKTFRTIKQKTQSRDNRNKKKTSSVSASPPPHAVEGRRIKGVHHGFLRSYVPTCARNTTRTYCVIDDHYPTEFLVSEVERQQYLWDKLWMTHFPQNSFYDDIFNITGRLQTTLQDTLYRQDTTAKITKASHQQKQKDLKKFYKGSEHSGGWMCPTQQQELKLGMAKNTRGHWRLLVNSLHENGPLVQQITHLEECLKPQTSCHLLTPLVASRCVQRYSLHNLLTWAPHEGFYVDTYALPSSCSCYVDKFNLSLLQNYVETLSL